MLRFGPMTSVMYHTVISQSNCDSELTLESYSFTHDINTHDSGSHTLPVCVWIYVYVKRNCIQVSFPLISAPPLRLYVCVCVSIWVCKSLCVCVFVCVR